MSKDKCTCSSFCLQYEGSCQCGYSDEIARQRKEEEKIKIIKEFIGTHRHTFHSIKCNNNGCEFWGHDAGDGHCTYSQEIELSTNGDTSAREDGNLKCLTFKNKWW